MKAICNFLGHALPFLVALLLPCNAFSQGGPPLATDDPGTPGDGNWEINLVIQWTTSDAASTLQFPLFDINYGYGDHIQLNLNTSLITVTPNGERSTTGLSVASVGTKWRFVDEDQFGWAISTFPRIDFHHELSSDNPQVNSTGQRYFLPLEFAKKFDLIDVNPEIGYASYSDSAAEWVYGLAISHLFAKGKELLFEIHGRSVVGTADQELLYNFGTRYDLTEKIIFIGSFGRTFEPYPDSFPSWNAYAGLQLLF